MTSNQGNAPSSRSPATAVRWGPLIRLAPLICGLATSLLTAWTWSSHGFAAEISDERAYLFQAEIFAHGKWKLPPRPMPEFFEEGNVFVTPFTASKYWPGHSLFLTPGVWLGWPPIVPLFLAAVAGALVFALARSIWGDVFGFVTWAAWVSIGPTLTIFASYFSETTTLVCWLMGWFALLRRYRGGGGQWTVIAMAATAWIIITRPLSGVAYAIPTGIMILYVERQRRSLRPLLFGAVVAAAIGAIIPLWCVKTTGDMSTVPWTLYARMYIPFDKLGFGLDSTAPLRVVPRDISNTYPLWKNLHVVHTADRLPSTVLERLQGLTGGLWPVPRVAIWVTLIVGMFSIPAVALVAVGALLSLFVLYLSYATLAQYVVYYVEVMPVLAFIATAGLRKILTVGERLWKNPLPTQWILSGIGVLALVASLRARTWARGFYADRQQLRMHVENLPTPRNLVFVRYPDSTQDAFEAVHNGPFLEKERNIVVFDLGPEKNASLAALYPHRKKYLMNVESWHRTTITALK